MHFYSQRWILTQARNYKGFHGTTRKVAVTSFVTRDHVHPSYKDSTLHVAIYNQTTTGERELFRHFVRRNDGSLHELFDNVALSGADDYEELSMQLLKMDDKIRKEGGDDGASLLASLSPK
jgi:hypothetical protein